MKTNKERNRDGNLATMAKAPIISIGIPVYNGERYLAETLDSILAQTFTDFEIIISDNASTDGTESVCRAYQDKDPRVKYYRNSENLGAAKNYNRAFHLSSGKYFKWAASDDLIEPELFETCVEVLENTPNVVLCYSKTNIIDENGRFVTEYEDRLHLDIDNVKKRFKQLIYTIAECNAVFGLIHSDILRKTRLIGNYIASDVCLLTELSLYGKFHEIPERLFFRRVHPKASSYDRSIENQLEFFDPKLKGKTAFIFWRQFIENWKSINTVPLNPFTKLTLYYYLTRLMIQSRKAHIRELKYALSNWYGRIRTQN